MADIEKIRRKVKKLPKDQVVRLGGMTDCFAPVELREHVTYKTIRALNESRVPYLIVTKSDLVAREGYLAILDPDFAHVQITVTCFDDNFYRALDYEKAPLPSKRIEAIEKLYDHGIDVSMRVSPFIPQYVDIDKLNAVRCEKVLIEFLRVNSWIAKWFDVDTTEYTVKQGGYRHLPLDKKVQLIKLIKNKRVSVCEDEDVAYEYWTNHLNPQPDDCCDLRRR